jgi:hypothetical protein
LFSFLVPRSSFFWFPDHQGVLKKTLSDNRAITFVEKGTLDEGYILFQKYQTSKEKLILEIFGEADFGNIDEK